MLLSEVMGDSNIAQLAKDLGITYNGDNVICYPDIQTKAAFMLACYGSFTQAKELIKERETA